MIQSVSTCPKPPCQFDPEANRSVLTCDHCGLDISEVTFSGIADPPPAPPAAVPAPLIQAPGRRVEPAAKVGDEPAGGRSSQPEGARRVTRQRWEKTKPSGAPPPRWQDSADAESAVVGIDELDAAKAFEEGQRIVTVIGFANSGKTFFVNRLREELPKLRWRCDRPPESEIAQTPEGLLFTGLVAPDSLGPRSLNYTVVDLAGESFRKALASHFKGGKTGGFSSTHYLAALAFANAYVLVIRAEDVAAIVRREVGDEQTARVERLINNFYTILSCIAICERKLQQGVDPRELLERGVSNDELKAAFRGRLVCRKPISVVFSQADSYQRSHQPEEGFDADPLLYAVESVPKLFNPIDSVFRHYRFDFMTAFSGHDTGTKMNYGLPHHGAVESFLWLHYLLDRGRGWLHAPRRIWRGGLATSHAVRFRGWVDHRFKQALNGLRAGTSR